MAIRTAVLLCLILIVMPGFSDDPKPGDPPEFYFTRLMYGDIYGGGRGLANFRGFGRGGAWMTDAWDADYKYMWGIQRMTNVKLHMDPHPLGIMDTGLFKYPYIYAVEVGHMELSSEEAARLREYLLRGGFWHCDDFWGVREWAQFAAQMKKVFPDRPIEELPLTHEIFHTFFDIQEIIQIPGEYAGCRGGPTWQRADDREPRIYGISNDKGRLLVVVTYNSDLGDAWEYADDPYYPEKVAGFAMRLGVNYVVYAMTH